MKKPDIFILRRTGHFHVALTQTNFVLDSIEKYMIYGSDFISIDTRRFKMFKNNEQTKKKMERNIWSGLLALLNINLLHYLKINHLISHLSNLWIIHCPLQDARVEE